MPGWPSLTARREFSIRSSPESTQPSGAENHASLSRISPAGTVAADAGSDSGVAAPSEGAAPGSGGADSPLSADASVSNELVVSPWVGDGVGVNADEVSGAVEGETGSARGGVDVPDDGLRMRESTRPINAINATAPAHQPGPTTRCDDRAFGVFSPKPSTAWRAVGSDCAAFTAPERGRPGSPRGRARRAAGWEWSELRCFMVVAQCTQR